MKWVERQFPVVWALVTRRGAVPSIARPGLHSLARALPPLFLSASIFFGSGPIQAQQFDVQTHQLTNGMKILMLEDHAVPNVALYFFHRVGSRNERVGLTGLSHFFEHMMFNGAKKYGPGQFDRTMEDHGGRNNAYTSEDLTVYQDWFPPEALPLIFDLEADRTWDLSFDPKMVELVRFNELPHLLGKVETSQDRMQAALQWAIQEMDNRYKLLESSKARDLESYNRKMQRRGQTTLPRIVVMIDELADLMMSRPEQTEFSLVRLAQLARATGIHLVVATQRPSAEIVTGLIKANFPARISFNVATAVDSRVILDVAGAETLLGKGDMLFINPEVGSLLRTQGVIVTDQEIAKAISFWKRITSTQTQEQAPWETMTSAIDTEEGEIGDDLIEQAIDIVRKSGKASASLLQRKMRIGFPRAARLIDELEEMGVIGSLQTGGKDREVIQGDRGYESIQSLDDEK